MALVATPLVVLAPGGYAHQATGSMAAITGFVDFPANVATTGGLPLAIAMPAFAPNALDTTGCIAPAARGIPFGDSKQDLCFKLTSVIMPVVGRFFNAIQGTSFACDGSGDVGNSTTTLPGDRGAFEGGFTCTGAQLVPGIPFLANASGHFHGDLNGAAIAFAGNIRCDSGPGAGTFGTALDTNCNSGGLVPVVGGGVASLIKHTLACRGTIAPKVFGLAKVDRFAMSLTCVID